MSDNVQTQAEKVIAYFNTTAIDYKVFWTGSEDLAMHFGYYDASVKSHKASLLKLNEVLATYAHISSSDKVLDAGCGYGGSAIWLAKVIGCQVIGISIVPHQVREAKISAERNKVSDKVSFEEMDYTKTSFPDASFDVVWGVESIVHTDNKKGFIEESYRLLRDGGRILISEYMLRDNPPLSQKEKDALSPWLNGWAMPDLLTPGEYTCLLEAAGFKNVQVHDITEHVKRSVTHVGKLQLPMFPTLQVATAVARVLCALRLFSRLRLQNFEAGIAQINSLRQGHWRYTVIVADKE